MELTRSEFISWLNDPRTVKVFEKVQRDNRPGPMVIPPSVDPEAQRHAAYGHNQFSLGWAQALTDLTEVFSDEDQEDELTDDYGVPDNPETE